MKPDVGYTETKIQPRVQDRGGQACQGAGCLWRKPPETLCKPWRARPRRRRLPGDEAQPGCQRVGESSGPAVCGRAAELEVDRRLHYIWTAEGWLYVSAVIDLFSRRVVGWSMSASMTAQLVADASHGRLAARQARCSVASLWAANTPARLRAWLMLKKGPP
jgi:transposase InsO family protein